MYLSFGDAMFGKFDDGKISSANGPFDVIESDADGIGLEASASFPTTAVASATAFTADSPLLHFHHLLCRRFIRLADFALK